jgi:hypothetical protein
MLHGLYILPQSCVDSHLALLQFSLRVFLPPSSLNHNGRQEGNQALSLSLSLERGFFFSEQCLNAAIVSIKINATTRVSVGGFLSPPALTYFWAGQAI